MAWSGQLSNLTNRVDIARAQDIITVPERTRGAQVEDQIHTACQFDKFIFTQPE